LVTVATGDRHFATVHHAPPVQGAAGQPAGQLLRNIGQVFSAAQPRKSASIPAGQIRHVFPIVVVHEPILRFAAAVGALAGELVAGLPGLVLRGDLEIHPL
jgi:hypothetical protein